MLHLADRDEPHPASVRIVHTSGDPEPFVIQSVGRRSTFTQTAPEGRQDRTRRIVAIGAAGTLDAADLRAQFDGCIASQESANQVG